MFSNRQEAGRRLGQLVAAQLAGMPEDKALPTIAVGLPRGGVPVGKEVATILQVPLTILVSKKIGAPFQPELALGAVSSRGVVILDKSLGDLVNRLDSYLQSQAAQLIEATKSREETWLRIAGIQAPMFTGKRVIVIDDGIATGMTTLAALRSIASEHPARLILAVPVISRQAYYRLRPECDGIIAIEAPADLQAIGQFYEDFHQVEDDEMLSSLAAANKQVHSAENSSPPRRDQAYEHRL